MKNIRILKILALSLAIVFMLPLFACDNTGNDESNNPPTPQEQEYFYKDFVKEPRFYAYEEFNSFEEAKNYVKSFRNDYELFIPTVSEADLIKIEFTTCIALEEREKFSHTVEYEIIRNEPFYSIKGYTTVFKKDEFNKGDLHFEIKDAGKSFSNTYSYNYNEDGKIVCSCDSIDTQDYDFGIKKDNVVMQYGFLTIEENQTMAVSEIKALIFDNIVPLSEQKNKEVSTNYMNNFDMTGPVQRINFNKNYYDLVKNIKDVGRATKTSCFVVNDEESVCAYINCIGQLGVIQYQELTRSGIMYEEEIKISKNSGEVEILVKPVITPTEIIETDNDSTFNYQFNIGEELENGYKFTIKNGQGIIINGTITAEEKTNINLQEIEQKLLSNIVLIKGE